VGTVDTIGLNFPDGKRTCITGKITAAPDNIDPANLMTLRLETTRVGGIPGASGGGACTAGGCAELQLQIAPLLDQMDENNFVFPASPKQPYHSDLLPGLGNNGANKKLTAAVRDIPQGDTVVPALDLKRRNPVMVKVCRDATPANARDNQTGTERLSYIYFVWRTILSPTTP